jgi:uncharacterized damage-inducible protein DinB
MSLISDAFAHHAWATIRLIDACSALSPHQLGAIVPATDRSILEMLQHLVGSDSFYLEILSRRAVTGANTNTMTTAGLRSVMVSNEEAWARLVASERDGDEPVREVDARDGFQRDATVGIRLTQALHHGTDHRTQICTALSLLGLEPPEIDGWTFGEITGRSVAGWPSRQ